MTWHTAKDFSKLVTTIIRITRGWKIMQKLFVMLLSLRLFFSVMLTILQILFVTKKVTQLHFPIMNDKFNFYCYFFEPIRNIFFMQRNILITFWVEMRHYIKSFCISFLSTLKNYVIRQIIRWLLKSSRSWKLVHCFRILKF